jgi:hypothetical protein
MRSPQDRFVLQTMPGRIGIRGVKIKKRVLTNHELLADTLLAYLDADPVVQKVLLVPKLPKKDGAIPFNAACGLQR